MIERPHFRYPFARDPATGKVGVVEQDTVNHVVSCEMVIVNCPLGARNERPEFGWDFPVFRTYPLDLGGLSAALARFEPRGRGQGSEYADAVDSAIRHIRVDEEITSA